MILFICNSRPPFGKMHRPGAFITKNTVYTVGALCIAHAFESAHPQSYVIAHKLLIRCFEVNFLHKYPIIGEICLIYSHFQQNCPYFSSYVTFYCIEICLPTAYFTSSRCVLKWGFPKFRLFFQNARLVFVVVNARPQLLQIFGRIVHGRYRARHRYIPKIYTLFVSVLGNAS